jgi:hypothetical protein
MARGSQTDTLGERLVVAFVSAVAAALTLALYPFALTLIAGGRGGGPEFEFAAFLYRFVFSNVGLSIIVGASVVGFLAGSERMANIFSFFWGTHSFWSDVGDRLDEFQTNHNIGLWVLVVLLAILAFVIYQNYA